jgi:hypothetical protein
MPSVLKRSRILYAVASSVKCKGDNGEALYIPANDRRGSGFVVSSALIRLGETSLAGVLQEFVFSKVAPNRPRRSASQP